MNRHIKFLPLILVGILYLNSTLNAQSWQWLNRFGHSSNGNSGDRISDIRIDNLNNVYVCGSMIPGTSFGATIPTSYGGSSDIFLAKYDCLGYLTWIRTAGGSSTDLATSLVLDQQGNIYFTGSITANLVTLVTFGDSSIMANTSDLFLAKYDTSGNFKWLQVAAPGNSVLNSGGGGIQINTTGNLVVYGASASTGNLFPGHSITSGQFIAEFSPSGGILSATTISPSLALFQRGGLKLDGNNNRYIAGYFTLDSIFLGSQKLTRISANSDGYVAKFNPSGNLVWHAQIGSSNVSATLVNGFDVSNNEVWIAGRADDSLQLGSFTIHNVLSSFYMPFIAKYNSSGTCVYADNVSAQGACWANGISVLNDTAAFTGSFRGLSLFGTDSITPVNIQDAFICFATPSGIFNSLPLNATGVDYDEGYLIGIGDFNNIYATGSFSGTMQLGTNSVSNSGGSFDGYLSKYGISCVTSIEEISSIHS